MMHEDIQNRERAAPRMQLSLPGTFLAVEGNHRCILTNLSKTGVLIALQEPMRIGAAGYLRCGPIDHFMVVTRKEKGMNALAFDLPVDDVFVFGIRQFQAQFAERELESLLAEAYAWTSGKSDSRS